MKVIAHRIIVKKNANGLIDFLLGNGTRDRVIYRKEELQHFIATCTLLTSSQGKVEYKGDGLFVLSSETGTEPIPIVERLKLMDSTEFGISMEENKATLEFFENDDFDYESL